MQVRFTTMANLPFKRVVYFLQIRFFNASPSPKTLKKPITGVKTNINGAISNAISPLSFHVQYLTNSCGLSLDAAISASKKVILEKKNKGQFDSVVSLLKSHNFSDAQIAKLVGKNAAVLLCRVSTIEPKIRFLAENGIVGSLLAKFLVISPRILFRSLDAQLKPAMTLVKRFITSPEMIVVVMQRGSWLLTSDWIGMQQNLDYLIEQGLPKRRIEELFILQPRCMYQDLARIKYAFKMIKDMGVKPNDGKFIHALRVVLSLSELSWKRKANIFESMGWSSEDVISTFVSNPYSMSFSEERLRRAVDYFVNIVKIDRKTIIGYSKVLTYSIEKRVMPRHTVWKILVERKLIQGKQFIWVLNLSEKNFIERYVTKFSDTIPNLLQIYETCKEESITPTKT